MSDTVIQPQATKFSNSFTTDIDKYIEIYKKQTKTPTVAGFGNRIGASAETLWAWANKKKKDEQGNILEELARPNFHSALTKLSALENEPKKEKLNARQEQFCKLYATDREFFGNGVQTYIEVYEPDQSKPNWYKQACSSASQILGNIEVCNRINDLLEDGGLNDQNVDKQLMFLINQFEDKSVKVAAIREYNKLKKRITEKQEIIHKGIPAQAVASPSILNGDTKDVSKDNSNQ